MSEEIFRQQERRRPTKTDIDNEDDPWEQAQNLREQLLSSDNSMPTNERLDPQERKLPFPNKPSEGGIEMKNVPPQLASFLKGNDPQENQGRNLQGNRKTPSRPEFSTGSRGSLENAKYNELVGRLKAKTSQYEEVVLPSKGKFYNGNDGPIDGIIYLKPMTAEEEQILATPRHMKRGKGMDMIFEACIREKIKAANLLSIDRLYLLVYLRIISFTPIYEVEVKCPECSHKYPASIDLNEMNIEECPDDFGPDNLYDVMPNSEFKFSYRLAKGSDDLEIQNYRERRSKQWGDSVSDDSLHYRLATLITDIEGVTDRSQIHQLIKQLPVNDVAYIRTLVNEPPFGMDTKIEMLCPSCMAEYTVDLPVESNFFFPRQKRSK